MPSSTLVEVEVKVEVEVEATFTGGWVVVQPSLVEVEAELGNTKLTLQKQKI